MSRPLPFTPCCACALLFLVAPAQADPSPTDPRTRYQLRVDSSIDADRWRGARPETIDRTDVRQRLGLDVLFAPTDPRPGRARSAFHVDLEVGSDLGPTPEALEAVPDGRRVEFDLHTAHLAVTNLPGRVDLRLGRHTLFDVLGYDALDGATVRVGAVPFLSAEAHAGLAVRRAWGGFGPDIHSPDGTRLTDRMGSIVGGALAARGVEGLDLRAAFRREFDEHVQRAELGVATRVSPFARLRLLGGARYDTLYLRVTEAWAGVEGEPVEWLTLGADWRRSLPVFSADSIWNAFSVEPYQAVVTRGTAHFGHWRLAADLELRRFESGERAAAQPGLAEPEPVPAVDDPWSWDVGGELRRTLFVGARAAHVGVEGRGASGYGGRRVYGDVFGRAPVWSTPGTPPLWLRGRLGAVHFDDAERRDRDGALSGWALFALAWRPAPSIHLETLSELHSSAHTPYRLRVMAQARFEDLW